MGNKSSKPSIFRSRKSKNHKNDKKEKNATEAKNDEEEKIDNSISNSFTDATKKEFAVHFAPQITLHNSEQYRFVNAQTYKSEMCQPENTNPNNLIWNDNIPVPLLDDKGESSHDKDGEYTYVMPNTNYIKTGSQDALLYSYFVGPSIDNSGKSGNNGKNSNNNYLIRIVYTIFYPFNGFQTMEVEYPTLSHGKKEFYFDIAPMARHIGDWEHVTVFIKLKDDIIIKSNNIDNNIKTDVNNYELYCIFASQHDHYNIGLSEKYFNKYNEDEKFQEAFDDSPAYSTSFGVKISGKKHKERIIEQIKTVDNNGITAMIFSSLNGHANHFDQKVYPVFSVGLGNKIFAPLGITSVKAVDITDASIGTENGDSKDFFLYTCVDPTNAETVIRLQNYLQDNKELFPDSLDGREHTMVLFEDTTNNNWYSIDGDNGGHKVQEWASWEGRWGAEQDNKAKNKLPKAMREDKTDQTKAFVGAWNAFLDNKDLFGDLKNKISENLPGPGSAIQKKWWVEKEPQPIFPPVSE